jgi:hypothetical protein
MSDELPKIKSTNHEEDDDNLFANITPLKDNKKQEVTEDNLFALDESPTDVLFDQVGYTTSDPKPQA